MKIKVCGLKHPENIKDVLALKPDFIGFIFYPKSKRFVGEDLDSVSTIELPAGTEKVGVFVNETTDQILACQQKLAFTFVQLHGSESPEQCMELKEKGLKVIKAFSPKEGDFSNTKAYETVCDYLLFDTPTEAYGGSGKKFDWSVLNNYHGELPFFLSGGISAEDVDAVKAFNHPKLFALDINSKFEIAPAWKSLDLLRTFFLGFNK